MAPEVISRNQYLCLSSTCLCIADRHRAQRQPILGGGHWLRRRAHYNDRQLRSLLDARQAETPSPPPVFPSPLFRHYLPPHSNRHLRHHLGVDEDAGLVISYTLA